MNGNSIFEPFENVPGPVFAVRGGQVIYENQAARRLMVEESLGRRGEELFDPGLLPPSIAPASGVFRHKNREFTVSASDFGDARVLTLSPVVSGDDTALRALRSFTGNIRSDVGSLFMSLSLLGESVPESERKRLMPRIAKSDKSACIIARMADNFARVFCGLDSVPELIPLDLRLLAEEMAVTVSSLEVEGQPKVRFTGADEPLPVIADGRLLEIMLMQLLSNSIKYSGRDAEISLSVRRGRRSLAIVVSDNGPGVRPELLGDVFAAYASPAQSVEPRAGSGLGLGIVQRIAAIHGGSAVMESAYGHGASVTVSIPRHDPDPFDRLHTSYRNDISDFLVQMSDVLDSSVYEDRANM